MRNRDLKKGGPQGVWLRSLRNSAGLNQAELADMLGVSRSQLSFYESGGEMPQRYKEALIKRFPDAPRVSEDESRWAWTSPPPRQDLNAWAPFFGVLPGSGSLSEHQAIAFDNEGTGGEELSRAPLTGLVKSSGAYELIEPFGPLQPTDLVYFVPSSAVRPGGFCLVEDHWESNRIMLAIVNYTPEGGIDFHSPRVHPDDWQTPKVVAKVVGILRRSGSNYKLWTDPVGLRDDGIIDF